MYVLYKKYVDFCSIILKYAYLFVYDKFNEGKYLLSAKLYRPIGNTTFKFPPIRLQNLNVKLTTEVYFK